MWTATVVSANPNPVPNDSFFIDVRFEEGVKSFVKTYKLFAGPELDVTAFVQGQLTNVGAMYAAIEDLTPTAISTVPDRVTNFQARAVLVQMGLFAAADAAIKGSGDELAVQAWEYTNNFYRTSTLVQTMGAALGLTPEQIDEMFVAAAGVEI